MCASTSFVANIDGRKIDETHCTLTRLNVVLSSDESHCGCWSGHEEGCGGHDCATAPHITAPHTIVIIATAGRVSGCAQIIPGSTFPPSPHTPLRIVGPGNESLARASKQVQMSKSPILARHNVNSQFDCSPPPAAGAHEFKEPCSRRDAHT